MEEYWFLAPMLMACDFVGFVEYFFSEALHDNLPVTLYGPSIRSIDKENCFV